jgi:hypothetical protein
MEGRNVLEDSVIYQEFVRRGEAKGRILVLRKILSRQAIRKFGPPSEVERDELESNCDLELLRRMADRIFDATSWADLLSTP